MPPKRLYLIDGHALCYRAFYAIKELTNSKGQATNAVFGFVSTVKKILKERKPDFVAVCFDSKEKTFRQEKFAEYKIQRPPMPDPLISQIPIIKNVAEAFKFTCYETPGFEADDIIATIVEKLKGENCEVVIVSEDKDLLQLAGKKVRFLSLRNDKEFGVDEIKSQYGFEPKLITDYLALAGDSVDNIPGVKGIGKVTAGKLVSEFGGLDGIYKNVDKISSASVKEKLTAQKKTAYLGHELTLLAANVPVDVSLASLKVLDPDAKRLYALFKDLEFRRFAEEFAGSEAADSFPGTVRPTDDKSLKKFIEAAKQSKQFAFLAEVTELQENSLFDNVALYVTADGIDVLKLGTKEAVAIKPLWENEDILKVTFGLKEQLKQLAGLTLTIPFNAFDVKLAAYVLLPSQPLDLNSLIWHYLEKSVPADNPFPAQAQAVIALFEACQKDIKAKKLDDLFFKLEMPLTFVLFKMQEEGVCLDVKLLGKLSIDAEKEMASLEKKLFKLAGEEFNLNSPKQLSHILFEKLSLPPIKKTKTGFSTDEGVLTQLAKTHELPALVLEFRQLSKLKSTYLDALPKLTDVKTKRLHADFDQAGAETGRLSSRNPNLQNIPIRTELGRQIRKAFIPSSTKNLLLAADYSQIELRILAHLSKDKTLIKAFQAGEDIHRYTASLIFEVKEKDVTPDMRYATKRVNFGIVYGMSAFGLAKDLGVSHGEAQEFIDKYFLRYPNVKIFMDAQIKQCEKEGFVETLLHRRRYIPEIKSSNMALRQFAQRQAINTPVQGSAADLMKLAMIKIQQQLERQNLASKMIITVHDELIFDMVEPEKSALIEIVKTQMEEAINLDVPVSVTMKSGHNWLEMQEIKFERER